MATVYNSGNDSVEKMLAIFRRKVMAEGIIQEYKKHTFFVKKSEKRRLEREMRRKKARKVETPFDPKKNDAEL